METFEPQEETKSSSSTSLTSTTGLKTRLYSWGEGKEGNLGNGSQDYEPLPFNIKQLNHKAIIQVKCGEWFCLALSASGALYGWGKASRSRFGAGDGEDIVYSPIEISLGFKVRTMAAGYWHSVVVSEEGKVFAVGDNKKGQLGLGHQDDVKEFTEVPGIENVVQVSAGCGFSFFLTEEGKLFSSGGGANGHKKKEVLVPTEIKKFEEPIIAIESGVDHAACITSSGKLYTWGDNAYKQLGHGKSVSTSKRLLTPKLVKSLSEIQITSVSCSKGFKECQTACVDSSGTAYFWGNGIKGKLGNMTKWVHNVDCDEYLPKPLKLKNISAVESAGIHSSVIDAEGKLYTFGCGSHGRLGHKRYVEGKYTHLYKESQPKRVEFFEGVGRIVGYSSTYSSNFALVEVE